MGNEIKADIFAVGDKIDASAVSKEKGFRVQSRDTDSTEDRWHMVLNSTAIRVPTVHVLHQAACSRAKGCRDIWAA